MGTIQVKCAILLDDGEKYYFTDDPGITVSEFSQARGTTDAEERIDFHKYSSSHFDFRYENGSSFDTLIRCLFNEIGFKYELAFEYGPLPLNVLVSNKLIQIENLDCNFEKFLNKYNIEAVLEIFLIYNNQAGSIWRDDGIEYYMNSREAGSHHRPHVHINYKNEYEASIAIDNGEVLAGIIPNRVLKNVRRRIIKEREFLFECWNEMTDGLRVDINHYFGKRTIVNTENIIW